MTTSYLDDAPLRYALQPFASRLQSQLWSPDQFMALLVAFAAGSWKPPEPGPVGVDADAVASKLAGDKAPAFPQLCLDCGVIVRNDGRTWRFRDAWLHGNLAARYLAQFLDGEYSERGLVRDRAVDALARIGSPAIPVLVAAFAHQDDMTGLGAAAAFWSLGPQSVPAVLDALSVGNDRVRCRAISALGSKDNANAALPALIRVMEQEQQPLVVAEAVTALRSSGNPDAEPALIAALRHDHPMVRMLAQGALEAFDSSRARRALEDVAPPVPARTSVSERSHDSG